MPNYVNIPNVEYCCKSDKEVRVMRNKRIQAAAEALGLAEKKVFTLGELERIAIESKCSVHEVMWYLRYERRLGN